MDLSVIAIRAGDLKTLARRVISGKLLNAGQLCVCPDYVVCMESEAAKFEAACLHILAEFFGPDAKKSDSYGRMIDSEVV